MNSISISYDLKWRFKDYPHIQLSDKRTIFNTKTGRIKRITTNGGSIGLWITSNRFIVKTELNKYIEKIPKKEHYPF